MKRKKQGRLILCFALLCLAPASPLSAPPVLAATTPEDSNLSNTDLLRQAYDKICKGNFDDAMPTLCQVVKNDRNSPSARRYLAFVLLQQGQAREALAQLDALTAIQPNGYPFDLLMKGVANSMTGHHEKALVLFQEAMAKDPKSDYYRIKVVDELTNLQKYDEAEKLAMEGYNNSKEAKITAAYHQKIKKIRNILRLTGHPRSEPR